MSFVKSILLFSVAGMLAGLGLSFVFPPRYTATATLVLTSDGTDPRSPQTVLDDYAEKALSAEKHPVRIAPVYRGTAHYAAVRISLKDSDRRQSVRTLNAFITRMIQPADQYARQGTESRSRALQARIAELKARLAALEAHKAVPPAPLAEVTAWRPPLLDVLDAPTVPRNPDFPGRGVYVLGGLVLGLICQAALYWLKWPKPKPLTS